MAKEKKVIQEPDRDELASLIAESLNKMNKDSDQVAFIQHRCSRRNKVCKVWWG